MAKEPVLSLKTGDPAPAFKTAASGGDSVALEDFRGRRVVLYFYPKDDTPGCTREACGFRDVYRQIEERGAVVLGVSPDSVKAHDKFSAKYQLPFTLLADESREIVKAYGVWGKKKFMGREYDGVYRVTFLIGKEGRIERIWPTVKPEAHAREVLEALA